MAKSGNFKSIGIGRIQTSWNVLGIFAGWGAGWVCNTSQIHCTHYYKLSPLILTKCFSYVNLYLYRKSDTFNKIGIWCKMSSCQIKNIKNNLHTVSRSVQHFPHQSCSIFTNKWLKTSSNPPPQSGSNLPPPTPRTSSNMVSALMSGWMAVSCPPRRSCVMPGWRTKKKRAGRNATEPAHQGNHLLRNPSCGRQCLLFTTPYGTVCTLTMFTVNMLLTVSTKVKLYSYSPFLTQVISTLVQKKEERK